MSVRMSEDLKIFQGSAYLVGKEALCARYRGKRATLCLHKLLHGALHDIRVIDHFECRVAGGQFPCDKRQRMVLQVIANAFVLNLALNAGGFEDLRITNTGQLKDLWRLNGAA